jgi:hypothetical protein
MEMSKSNSSLCIAFLALGLFLFLLTPKSQSLAPAEPQNPFTVTREILQAFYPEIFSNGWYVNFSTGQPIDSSPWGQFWGSGFKVMRFSPGVSWNPTFDATTGKMRPTPENTEFLEGSTWIGNHGEILRLIVNGNLACSDKTETIRKLVESHPEWPETQAIQALKQAGARYGPAEKEQFVSSLHLENAEKVLGRLKIKLVEFDGLSDEHVGDFARLFWIVHAEGQFPDGSHRLYGFSFEPFEGKLIGLSPITDVSR